MYYLFLCLSCLAAQYSTYINVFILVSELFVLFCHSLYSKTTFKSAINNNPARAYSEVIIAITCVWCGNHKMNVYKMHTIITMGVSIKLQNHAKMIKLK